MASAQVLPNSRKLGHLEAGKKKLEEFRKKKAEGRAKKAASTGQWSSADADQNEKVPQKHEGIRDGSYSANGPYGMDVSDENEAVNSSETTGICLHGSSTVLVDDNHASYGESGQNSGKEVPNLYKSVKFPEPVNGYYDHLKRSNELDFKKNTNFKPSSGDSGMDHLDTFNSAKTSPHLDMNINNSINAPPDEDRNPSKVHVAHPKTSIVNSLTVPETNPHIDMNINNSINAPLDEDRNSSKVHMAHPKTSFVNSLTAPEHGERVSWQDKLGLPSTSSDIAGLHNESPPGMHPSHPCNLYENSATNFSMGGGKIDSTYDNLNAERAYWHTSEPSYKDSNIAYKGTQYEYPFASTGFGTSSGRSRPSFLDSLGISSAVHVLYGDPQKANTPVPSDTLKVQSTQIPLAHSPLQPSKKFNISDQSFKSITPDAFSEELSMNILVSSNDDRLLASAEDHRANRDNEFSSKKDEDFAALEQHIEDLMQEKFSLQRALETSRMLAGSLATENTSLTESYNQQGKSVSQLKSDMEGFKEEIKGQLLALESLRSEYMNAQLECNAADERAKILVSEVIGLEEKALRLRSNEIKLEKESENLKSEISSYKRRVSILEKERQDFQSTIDALQEEKKLLNSKLRKVPVNEKIDVKTTSTKRDVCTSTADLGVDPLNFVDGEMGINVGRLNSTRNLAQDSESVILPSDDSSSLMVSADLTLALPGSSVDIPQDQLRMIENINSLISELALEKEELVGALKIESFNCAKLKDLNKDLSQKLEAQTQRLELLATQRMVNENSLARSIDAHISQYTPQYADEGDEVVERVLGWIMKLFPGGPSKRRTSQLL